MATISKRKIKQQTGQNGKDTSLTQRGYNRIIQREMEKHAHEFNLTIDDVRERETFAEKRRKIFGR